MREVLTHSRIETFKLCRKKHEYAYEIGLRRTDDARALRMGSAYHAGIEQLGKDKDIGAACAAVRTHYQHCPPYIEPYEWAIECETILRLVCAYQWRWADDQVENVETEFSWQIPLVNPATGKPTPVFDLAGKIDGIVRLRDGRLAIKETKTFGEDIGPDAFLWRRLRMDHQISMYIIAARALGYPIDTVLYDVCRKPSIAPTAIPLTDADGIKIVLDADGLRVRNANGKSWKQTSDAEKGYVLQSRLMTPSEWGEKLTADICERPDFYFRRAEIARLDQDLEEFQHEAWAIQLAIREAQRTGRHFRTVNRNTCQYCPVFDACSTNMKLDPAHPPEGFEFVKDTSPELERETHAIRTPDIAAASPASSEDASSAAAAEAAIA